MKIDRVIVGYLKTNCYIISNDNECLVIDPGDEYDKIKEVIGNKRVIGTIVTHHHFDHVGALKYFDNIYDKSNLIEGMNKIGKFNFEVIYTPGHSNDSISFYFRENKMMFVGDFIFKDSIGRCDLPTGSEEEMKKSIDKILKFDNNIKLYPGHYDITDLDFEKKNNPFLKA